MQVAESLINIRQVGNMRCLVIGTEGRIPVNLASLRGSETGVDPVFIQTSLLFMSKSGCCYAHKFALTCERQGPYQTI